MTNLSTRVRSKGNAHRWNPRPPIEKLGNRTLEQAPHRLQAVVVAQLLASSSKCPHQLLGTILGCASQLMES